LIETVKQCGELAPSQIIARVMQAADGFVAGAKQHDDMTLVVLCANLSLAHLEVTETRFQPRVGGLSRNNR
jgi:hypothetical protein